MANPLYITTEIGTVGELLVQIRLLQHSVQAAPPLKDSGNDLVALRGLAVRTIQVKTTTGRVPEWPSDDVIFHLLAIVRLFKKGTSLLLDKSKVYLVPKSRLGSLKRTWDALEEFVLSKQHVSTLFTDE